jgi:pilus assembly protein CpaE
MTMIEGSGAAANDGGPRAAPYTRLHVFCEDTGTAETVNATLESRFNGLACTTRMGGVHNARAAYDQAPTPELLVVESLLDAAGMLADLDMLAPVCDAATKVIVIGHVNDVLLYRALMRRGISDYLVAPVDGGQLAQAIAAALKREPAETAGRVVAFIGAKGGCGSSTICHNTAWVLAEMLKTGTVIADFDTAFGTLGLDFNQEAGQGLAEALAASHKLDRAVIDHLLAKCSDHLGLLTASYLLDADADIDAGDAVRLVEALSQTVPFVILDLPGEWRAWSRSLIELADLVVIIAEPDLANLRNGKNLIDTARALRATGKPPMLVMNKVGLPRRPEIPIRDFANAVDLEPVAEIGFDAELFGTAANNGLMIGEFAPKSRQLKLFRAFAETLSGKVAVAGDAAGLIRPIIERLSRKLAH